MLLWLYPLQKSLLFFIHLIYKLVVHNRYIGMYSTGHKYCNISTGVLVDFHMIHYTQIIWEEVAFIWKVTRKAVAIFMSSTVCMVSCMTVFFVWMCVL